MDKIKTILESFENYEVSPLKSFNNDQIERYEHFDEVSNLYLTECENMKSEFSEYKAWKVWNQVNEREIKFFKRIKELNNYELIVKKFTNNFYKDKELEFIARY